MQKMILCLACIFSVPAAFATGSSTTANGGVVHFTGTVVKTACSVSSKSVNFMIKLNLVRVSKLLANGMVANKKTPFYIDLKDCDTSVSSNASVTFEGESDGNSGDLLNTARAGAAGHVALKLYGPDGSELPLGQQSSLFHLVNGDNTIPFAVDYQSTSKLASPGNVEAQATFVMTYS